MCGESWDCIMCGAENAADELCCYNCGADND